jgi:hypothetical protein
MERFARSNNKCFFNKTVSTVLDKHNSVGGWVVGWLGGWVVVKTRKNHYLNYWRFARFARESKIGVFKANTSKSFY